jgi:NADH-quinone oxidoreductase subunit N
MPLASVSFAPEQFFPVPSIDWLVILPIVIVITTGIVALTIEILRPKRNNNLIVGTCLLGLGIAGVATVWQFGMPATDTLARMVVRDQFGLIMQLLLILSAFLAILFSEGYLREKRIPFGEFYPLVLWSTAGGMVMAATQNLLGIFVGLELLSISLYVMAGMARNELQSEESALKYFLLGAFASGFFLYGMAFFFGATGSLHLDHIGTAWEAGEHGRPLLIFGLGLMLIGLGFKASLVPFHQWTPDVYQGAPTNVTAFMAAGSKVAAFAALWRVLEGSLPLVDLWVPVLFWLAILTMTVGNVVALVQRDVKRILGYSSVAHAGYILVALLAHFRNPAEVGIGATAYYLFAYSLMTIGAFAIVSMTARDGREGTSIENLYGLWRRSPMMGVALVIFMASLIGVPITAGFFGKLFIFMDALRADLLPLAIVLAINSVISIYYYLGIALAAFVQEEEPEARPLGRMHGGLAASVAICAIGVMGIAIFMNPLLTWMLRGDATLQATEPAVVRQMTPFEFASEGPTRSGEPRTPNPVP